MSKSILYLGGFELPDKNAAAQRVMSNALLLRDMGYDVSFVGISKDLKSAPQIVNGFISNPIPYAQNIKQWLHQILTFVETKQIFKYNPNYVILYNFPAVASLRIMNACHKHGIMVIHDLTEWEVSKGYSLRSLFRNLDTNLRMHYCIPKMDGVIAISRYLYDYYTHYTNVIFVPPLIDLEAKKWNRNRSLSYEGKIRLVYAGNAGYGIKDRLDIIVNSVKKYQKMQLDVIGMTKEDYVKGYGQFPEGCDNIIFHGRVDHRKAIETVQDAAFQFIIRDSNLKNNAGFPTKFVESMACCTPVIATLTSNMVDYLKNGKNGYIVDTEHTLDNVLDEISSLSFERIIQMKESCRQITVFDYRAYKSEFSKIFM